MKKNKFNIFCSWLLLICFATGQYVVYAHQHEDTQKSCSVYSIPKAQQHPITVIQEKCPLCDAMHHTFMAINSQAYFSPVIATSHIYKAYGYSFISFALVLSTGRAPPVASFSC